MYSGTMLLASYSLVADYVYHCFQFWRSVEIECTLLFLTFYLNLTEGKGWLHVLSLGGCSLWSPVTVWKGVLLLPLKIPEYLLVKPFHTLLGHSDPGRQKTHNIS